MSTPSSAKNSKVARDALRRRMTELGSPIAAVAAEMRTHFGFRPREAWRHAHGWSLQQVADRLNDRSGQQGETIAAETSTVSKWERWPVMSTRRRPTIPVLIALADVYGCQVEDLLDLQDRAELPAWELAVLNRMTPADAEPSGAELVQLAADESLTWARWAETTNVGSFSLEQLWGQTQLLASQYVQPDSTPMALFNSARELRAEVGRLLGGHQHPHQARELYTISGYLCSLLAWMSSDLGHIAEAETQSETAWLCAELARSDTLRAWILSVRSKTAFWNGRLDDALQHARRGASYSPCGTVTVLLACQEADAWSQLGAVDEALDALTRAEAAREAVAGADDIGGLFACTPARQENYAAAAQLRIGRPTDALESADRALCLINAQPVRAYGTVAQIHISRAAAHLHLAELDGAYEALRPVLTLSPDRRLAPVTDRLMQLGAGLGQIRVAGRAVVGLRAAIDEFGRDSAPRRLAALSSGRDDA
ncbi:helix-turn-helix transcriptional regulator [Streptomyces sp. NPDC026672]|uniref:helix-turn-helix transcriptional regulator n=1 Tax=unclassified Streptomyces TaxID=2593676 RepID=UPI0033D20746